MLRNYLTITFRNFVKNKLYSAINILGLAAGMAVAMLIGLWIWDELNFNKSFAHYDRLTQAHMFQTFNGHIGDQTAIPVPLGNELREKYADFEQVALASWNFDHIVAYKEKQFTRSGMHVEPPFVRMFSPTILKGSANGLQDVNSVMLSETLANTLFGTEDPIHKIIKLDNKASMTVTAVYKDFPANSELAEVWLLAPWSYYLTDQPWVKRAATNWNNNSFQCFVQLKEKTHLEKLNARIKNLVLEHRDANGKLSKPVLFLYPMEKWHLYSEFKEGVHIGGRIQFVWLFGIIGLFVLTLACINFMNLSTARSEKRAKEIGIRKAIGSIRSQLIGQFLCESILTALLAFGVALLLVNLSLSWFNELAGKQLSMVWAQPYFWMVSLFFVLLTGLLSGSYPALYLSSFDPVRVLKGTFKAGRGASVPRKVLVVVQFTVSVTLIIGTMIVYQQIQYGKNRPVGYNRNGLLYVFMNTPDLYGKYQVLRTDLLATGVVENMSESSGPLTDVWSNNIGFSWEGKDPDTQPLFSTIYCTHEYGKTAGLTILEGRDFSRQFATDSSAMLINEEAAKIIGKDAIGKYILSDGDKKRYQVVGIVKNMMMGSPYTPSMPALFMIDYEYVNIITVRIKPTVSAAAALPAIGAVFRKHNPGSPFDYKFVDQEYGKKFESEERIGKLAAVFAVLAIFISCLGLFGLASFLAEQRTKEIGVRKVLGASVFNLWQLLSKDFIYLVLISCAIAVPIAWYFLNNWLQKYEYRTEISWWIFILAGIGALGIALLTVSYQAIKAASANPVKSLRTE